MIIYKITNLINGKQYIGQSMFSLEQRWEWHLASYRKNSPQYLYRAMRKHGIENFKIEQVMRCVNEKDLNNKETFCVRIYNTFAAYGRGYNCTTGGNQYRLDEESKKKIGLKKKGKKLSREQAKKNKQYAIDAMNNPIIKRKFLIANGCKWFFAYEAILLERHSNQKPSKVSKGKLIGKWLNVTDCGKDLGINSKGIYKNLINGSKTYKGYLFEYEGEPKNLEGVSNFCPKNNKTSRKVRKEIVLLETGDVFISAAEAARKLGLNRTYVCVSAREEKKIYNKYTFKYIK